ncbi:hypothetical protein D3C75_933770 [compost metagenome]|uniref:Uncharacterized protein n=1 Tax=Paenibacillus jilunlii TaxID=682956 RepID=A0A1G9PHW5_9BACL|nr:hypothetical protein [Paenibacillus jilunlii]SDL98314.1 hypothetical protein SAMN05216191_107204 [Paenibacillus jilunlii]
MYGKRLHPDNANQELALAGYAGNTQPGSQTGHAGNGKRSYNLLADADERYDANQLIIA